LPVTWPRDIGQAPIFYAARPSGRPANPDDHYTSKYLDLPVTPQFPFGHGLSYASFKLSNLSVSAAAFGPGEAMVVTVDVANQGAVAGEATIFLFVRDVVASVARPLLELKAFAKIALAPRAQGTVRLSLAGSAFAFPDAQFRPRVEPGRFELSVGLSADRAQLLTIAVEAIA
jgi:beta-glucosidase